MRSVCLLLLLAALTGCGASSIATEVDCDDADASDWQMKPYVSRDTDADGFSVASSGQECSGPALPAGYGTTVAPNVSADCDDSSTATWRVMTTYVDADNDAVGADPAEPNVGIISCGLEIRT